MPYLRNLSTECLCFVSLDSSGATASLGTEEAVCLHMTQHATLTQSGQHQPAPGPSPPPPLTGNESKREEEAFHLKEVRDANEECGCRVGNNRLFCYRLISMNLIIESS